MKGIEKEILITIIIIVLCMIIAIMFVSGLLNFDAMDLIPA